MSDYLFRMVERAAGMTAASAPQPPREFHWPAPGLLSPVASLLNPGIPQPRNRDGESTMPFIAPRDAETSHENGGVDTAVGGPASLESLTPRPHESVSREATGQLLIPRSQSVTPAVRKEISNSNRDPMTAARSTMEAQPLSAPDMEWNSQVLPALPAAETSMIAVVRPNQPLRTRRDMPPRQTATTAAREIAEPTVEVKIGRVEVRFDTPAKPAVPAQPSRPIGFAEFTALRRYATQPWSSGNR